MTDAFLAHWTRTSALPNVVHRSILADDAVAGHVVAMLPTLRPAVQEALTPPS